MFHKRINKWLFVKIVLMLMISLFSINTTTAQVDVVGKRYKAEVGMSCKLFSDGGCTTITYCLLDFDRDSVSVGYKMEADCFPEDRSASYNEMYKQLYKKSIKRYKWGYYKNFVTIQSFNDYGTLSMKENQLVSQKKTGTDDQSQPLIFEEEKIEDDYWVSYEDDSCRCFGYKNKAGEVAIKPTYLTATDTFRTVAIVGENGRLEMIDRQKNVLLYPYIYDNGPDYEVEGVFRFGENGKIGFADSTGRKVIAAQFDFVTPFEDGIAEYTMGGYKEHIPPSDEHWFWVGGYETGYINHEGKRFAKVTELKSGKREVWTADGEHFILNEKGEIQK